ncbi:hypothetical protein D3C80_1521530 [compost metagenome]
MAEGVHRPADLGQGDHGDHWQTDSGDQEAQGRHPYVRAGLQADDGREDDVACSNEQGKSHKTKRQDILAFQDVHEGKYHSAETGLAEVFLMARGQYAPAFSESRHP